MTAGTTNAPAVGTGAMADTRSIVVSLPKHEITIAKTARWCAPSPTSQPDAPGT